MSNTINVDDLSKEIQKIMDEYQADVQKVVDETLPKVATKAVKELKSKSPTRSGKYKKGWTKKVEKGRLGTTIIVYNKNKPQLTHLLEHGHAKRNGGRVDGIKHIKPAEDSALKEAVKLIKRGL